MSIDDPRPPAGTGDDEPTVAAAAVPGGASDDTRATSTVRPSTIAPGESVPSWLDAPPVSAEETQAKDREAAREAKEAAKEARAETRAQKRAARKEKKANRTKPHLLRRIPVVVYALAALLVLLGIYYAVVLSSGAPKSSRDVPTATNIDSNAASVRVDLRIEQIDSTRRTAQLFLLPVPLDASLGNGTPGELAGDLRIEVTGAGATPASFTFPANSTIDEVSTRVPLESGPESYPFDEPTASFRIRVADQESGDAESGTVALTNGTGNFELTADVGAMRNDDIAVKVQGERDELTIALVLLQLATIVLSTIIALIVVAVAITRRRVELAVVIWLGATLIAVPALRNAMPDAPPIGTRIDYLVLFPCMAVIAGSLLMTALLLLVRRPREADVDEGATTATPAEDEATDADAEVDATATEHSDDTGDADTTSGRDGDGVPVTAGATPDDEVWKPPEPNKAPHTPPESTWS